MYTEKLNGQKQQMQWSLQAEPLSEDIGFHVGGRGRFTITLMDEKTGEVLDYRVKDNIIVKDAGIIVARLLKNAQDPVPGQNNGVTMLAVGTGATGAVLSPDAPTIYQRALNTELARKGFSATQFRDSLGNAVAYPTNIVDYTCTFASGEANGSLNEMGLMHTYSLNTGVQNLVSPALGAYNAATDVTNKDLLLNYSTMGAITKTIGAILTVTWRITA